ncbi:SurA N-terminal domain-containing protein [Ramlibacter sp. USB13]|uniref:Periplasmic chaperone PpiD n=1 Tax=Ramlibacter cellulosilyticus TaxID=2764187 RepID=A0A923MW72_9BURK|nr:SurA N-terminal domain-containing protein [Ramlibacter cellulosilyticus]MBC5785838.1 SurA N-terminal domain-containing protein [Ramlibacter cellulosilyticus]
MFDFVRKHTKVMQFLLFLLIVPSFVLFGLQGYDRMHQKGEVVAKVDGQEIHQGEWDEAHKQQVDRLREQMPNLDAKLFDSAEAKYGTLERIVRERVLAAAAANSHFLVADQRVARELQSNELIGALRGPDGRLDIERYRQVLAARGMTPEMFENSVRNDLALRQVVNGVAQSSFTPAAQAGVSLGSFFERREVQLARFNAADFKAKVEPTDAELQAFYKDNAKLFQAPEQANIEYVVLDLATVEKGVTVNEADLKTYYEQNASRLAGKPEERRASHILVTVAKGASAEDKAKAKAKAEELLAQVRKSPDSFAEVAKKNSQDPGSAAQGGDLDFFARGAMTKPFEDAVFAMKNKGDISDVVESEFGYHIIRLTDIKADKPKTFEELKPQLEAQVRKEQAQKKYAEAAETFSNTVYEQSDSLKPVADKLKLEIRTAQNVTRTPQPGTAGPLGNPKFLAAVFSPDAVERKRNTEAVEVGPNQMVSGRITQHSPAHTRSFDEVKAQVREQVVAAKAAELAKKEGEAKLAAWKAAPATAQLGAAESVSRQDAKHPRQVIEAALRADPAKLPALVGVDLGPEGYAVVQVNKVLPREAPAPQQAQQEQQQYARAWAMAEAAAYYEELKQRFKVQINVPKPKEGTSTQ